MTDYVKSTNFSSKDSLASGNPLKIVKGTEFDIEFNNIATAIASKADTTSPTFAGTPLAPTAAAGTNTTQLATTAFVTAADTVAVAAAATAAAAAYPTKAGAGATGTWGINITGNAATATSATTAGNGGVTSVNGMTGAVSLSTTPSTSQVLTATAGATAGAVGTYSWLVQATDTTSIISVGSTYSGSSLRYAGSYAGSVIASANAPSGTWRAMSETQSTAGLTSRSALFLRIS